MHPSWPAPLSCMLYQNHMVLLHNPVPHSFPSMLPWMCLPWPMLYLLVTPMYPSEPTLLPPPYNVPDLLGTPHILLSTSKHPSLAAPSEPTGHPSHSPMTIMQPSWTVPLPQPTQHLLHTSIHPSKPVHLSFSPITPQFLTYTPPHPLAPFPTWWLSTCLLALNLHLPAGFPWLSPC